MSSPQTQTLRQAFNYKSFISDVISGNTLGGMRIWNNNRKEAHSKCIIKLFLLWRIRILSYWGTQEECKVHPQIYPPKQARKLGYLSTNSLSGIAWGLLPKTSCSTFEWPSGFSLSGRNPLGKESPTLAISNLQHIEINAEYRRNSPTAIEICYTNPATCIKTWSFQTLYHWYRSLKLCEQVLLLITW